MTTVDTLRETAASEAAALGSAFIGSEHLFLAWLVTGSGAAHEASATAGLTADTFRTLISAKAGAPRRGAATEEGGLSSHAQRVFTTATEIAAADDRSESNADDVFLALIREPRGAVARALSEAKLKPSVLRSLARPGAAKIPVTPKREKVTLPTSDGEAAVQPVPAPRTRREPSPPREKERNAPPKPRRDPEIDDIPEPRAPERPKLTPPPKPPAPPKKTERRWSPLWICYLAVPVTLWLHFAGGDPTALFAASCISIIPLAALIANATEQIAARTGPIVGGFLNATFGNATEVIVAILALRAGYGELVKASLTGSILSNLLLILGLALFTGGLRQHTLKFSKTAAGMSAAMLALAVAGLILPSIVLPANAGNVAVLSQVVAAILAVTYIGSLLFTMHTHKRLFAGGDHASLDGGKPWSMGVAIAVLAAATVVVSVESEFLVDTIGSVTQSFHLSQVFLGLIVIPIVGNAAEHASAIVAARKGRTELAVQIAVGSSTQVALLVAPLLVLVAAVMQWQLTLVFPLFQVAALGIATIVSAIVTLDGESHWLEGMQLLALYAMIAAAAWFI